jgi:4-hydroxybenzoate polyprenyltransferase
MKIYKTVFAMIKVVRPTHWVKNMSLFAALIFTGTLFIPSYFITVVLAFFSFSFAASASYILNDVLDADRDRLHPIKKNRPVAAGVLPIQLALTEGLILVVFALMLAYELNYLFFVALLVYVVLQIAYSLFLKNLPVIDILVIASGFILRVYAGAFVINAHLSVWFLLCVISAALFLAAGKRRAELNSFLNTNKLTRKTLSKYPRELLNSYVTMFGNAAWMSWALYTFFESPRASLPVWLVLAELSKATTINKLMMITIPVVIFGIMRYENLIFEEKTEAPEKLLLTDISLVGSVFVWLMLVVWILYGGVSA